MKILLPFTGAIAEAAGTIYEKRLLRRKKLDYLAYNVFSFLSISVIIGILILLFGNIFPSIFGFNITPGAFSTKGIMIMLEVILFSIAANLFTFYAFKWEKLTEVEPIRILQPLFSIVFAFIFLASERDLSAKIIIAAIIASLALFFSHIRKHHFVMNKYSISALLGSLFFAIELVLSRTILDYYTPMSFYLVRCFFIFAISAFLFRPAIGSIPKGTWKSVIGIGGIWVLYRVLLYIGYIHSGVIFTTLTLSLVTPIFIYILAYTTLREKPTWRNILASIVILACVIWAMI